MRDEGVVMTSSGALSWSLMTRNVVIRLLLLLAFNFPSGSLRSHPDTLRSVRSSPRRLEYNKKKNKKHESVPQGQTGSVSHHLASTQLDRAADVPTRAAWDAGVTLNNVGRVVVLSYLSLASSGPKQLESRSVSPHSVTPRVNLVCNSLLFSFFFFVPS